MEKFILLLCLVSPAFSINLRNTTKFHVQPGHLKPTPVTHAQTQQPITAELPSTRLQNSTLCSVKIFRKLRLPWLDAFAACKALGNGSELVSLRSEEDYSLVTSALRDFDSPLPVIFWTSGVDLVEEGVFSWMSDGTTVDMDKFWLSGQPDNLWDTEHCLGLRRRLFDKDYKLADENCHLAGAFVCAQRCGA